MYQNGKNYYMLVSAKLPKAPTGQKYVIWLYNGQKQFAPVASDVPDKNGNLQGLRPLPNGWQNYRFVDITQQSVSGKKVKHGRSVLRGPLVVPQPSGSTGTSTSTGTTTTP